MLVFKDQEPVNIISFKMIVESELYSKHKIGPCQFKEYGLVTSRLLGETYFSSVKVEGSMVTSNFCLGSGGVRR